MKRIDQWLLMLLIIGLAVMLPHGARAEDLNINLGGMEGGSATARMIQLILLLTVLTLAPSILVMVTCFTRVVIILSFLRTAIGTQTTPPNQVIMSLALFLSLFIMAPTFEQAYNDGVLPLIEESITEEQALERSAEPFRIFMRDRDLELVVNMSPEAKLEKREETPYQILIPAFMISELKRAFEIGFLLFIPFLIIDLLVASILMAMGMMMLPPVIISLPFKLIFFVLVDGWYMIVGSIARSYGL
jgi:flagellar biosynthesis protein FliP